ncbi:MAG: hypothetical protein CFE21_16880 [Bacteroidetes bacterium B1(2017)]|nr:MAG: hypothetical protein CFE21_16880 [Bacteroidetes bacterium B1(2017)]
MASDYFDFKQVRIYHQNCAMKVGTDSVVLGALVNLGSNQKEMLDIGTGSGVLALMLAQRCQATITGIELDHGAFEEAHMNFKNSPWASRLSAQQISFQEFAHFASKQYELIISNPPYFENKKNVSILDQQRSKARHDADLPFADLALGVTKLLAPNASFWLILPPIEAQLFLEEATKSNLVLNQKINIYSKPDKPIKRVILELKKEASMPSESNFYLQDRNGEMSAEYKEATSDFYL